MDVSIRNIPLSEADVIKTCWEKLNAIHLRDSIYFADHYAGFTFEKRMEAIARLSPLDVKLTVVTAGGDVRGYCLSTVENRVGEIASLYVDEDLRGRAVGKRLVELHKNWFRTRGCGKVVVSVSHGHDSVLGFYRKLGFYERLVVLELKE